MNPFSVAPLPFNFADLNADQFQIALDRTAHFLRKIDEVRKKLELPIDQLPLVVEIYGKNVLALVAEEQRKEMEQRTQRLPIEMRSDAAIIPKRVAEVFVRPQFVAFRLEDISIHGDRTHWLVHDVKVGNRRQFEGRLFDRIPVPGVEFGPDGVCASLRFETCQTAMDLVLMVEYVGPNPEGEVFEATLVGTSVAY
jgi:hypothetical protein